MAVEISTLVDQALEHGSLYGLGYGRTITVAGKRRLLIRVQCDIFGRVHSRGAATPYYPDLLEAIDPAVDAWRAAHLPSQVPRGLRP
jgi:hypothetical protein